MFESMGEMARVSFMETHRMSCPMFGIVSAALAEGIEYPKVGGIAAVLWCHESSYAI